MSATLDATHRTRPQPSTRKRVLCVDDDASVLALCKAALTRAGFEVDTAGNGWEALRFLNDHSYSAVLIDLMMPSLHGRTVLSMMQQTHADLLPRLIVMTGATDNAIEDLYGKVGGILRKPLKIDSLVDFVNDFAKPHAS